MANWKDVVRSIAPTIGTALGGPMAGTAVKFIAEKLLGNAEATEKDIEEAILTASPEDLVKLKEIDTQFTLEMKKLEIDLYALEYKDRDSARNMFAVNIWPQIILSATFVIGYFTVLYYLIESDTATALSGNMMGVFTTVLGVLTAAIPQILNFWFGSSLGSKEKTQGLNVAAEKVTAR